MAAKDGIEVYYIGTLEAEGITTVKVAMMKKVMIRWKKLLASRNRRCGNDAFPIPNRGIDGWTFVTPAKGREMFIANTTGTSSSDRIEGMIKNTIYGIIAAKACGKSIRL